MNTGPATDSGEERIIEELRGTLEAARETGGPQLREYLEDLLRVREQLNTYVCELHERREPLGRSLYQMIGEAEKLSSVPDVRSALPWEDPLTVGRGELNSALDALADLAAQAEVFDRRESHQWRGLAVEVGKPVRRDVVEGDLISLGQAVRTAKQGLETLREICAGSIESASLDTLWTLSEGLAGIPSLDRLPAGWGTRSIEDLHATAGLLETASATVTGIESKRGEFRRFVRVPPEDACRVLAALEGEYRGRGRIVRPTYWRWRHSVARILQKGVPKTIRSLRAYLKSARRIRQLDAWLEEHHEALVREVGLVVTLEANSLAAGANRLRAAAELRKALYLCGLEPQLDSPSLSAEVRRSAESLAGVAQDAMLKSAIERLEELWPRGFVDGVPAKTSSLASTLARCEELLAALPKIHEWITLRHTLSKCYTLGLAEFIERLGSVSAKLARKTFERRFCTAWVNMAVESSSTLAAFSGVRREEQVDRFRKLDAKVRHAALAHVKAVASGPGRRVAEAQTGGGTASEVGILRRELEKRRRIKPLRKLFAEVPNVLQALKPCLLMSPLSVSTFLKPGVVSFDLVVFDEASQLPTQEAIPAILRAKQVVVSGDKNQLPPTSFFDTSVIFDEDGDETGLKEELEPLESLLNDCVAVYPVFEQAHLGWHYRSKDERLIKFSNHYFYREKPLITFPAFATVAEGQGVRLAYVADGVWDRGGSRTNRTEARRVAQLVVQELEQRPERSLGVVAMNTAQREAIEEALDELVVERSELAPLLSPENEESFFIKALENVQGDERDTIIISVGYGRNPGGALTYNFGPLNQEGGWRRLNVLVTRARWQTILVTSMRSQELAGVNPNNGGAVALRNFIAYVERGGELPPDRAVLTTAETNDFEDAVAEAIKERGFGVDQQVGASGYRIDLAVLDPRDLSRYLLGVECDGATYHSAKAARDRDLLRQEVLRQQGWRLYRVWSTDWFRDREKALAGLLRALERALEHSPDDSILAPTKGSRSDSPDEGLTAGQREQSRTKDAERTISIPRRHPAGEPYRKYRGPGRRELLLNRNEVARLASQIVGIVHFEGPIHKELLTERLKEVNGVSRAGANVEANISRAMDFAIRSAVVRADGEFLRHRESGRERFRTPSDGVERQAEWIPPEEIELSVLHIVEDQFAYQYQALARAVGAQFGFERAPAGWVEMLENIVDKLIEHGRLVKSGPNVSLP